MASVSTTHAQIAIDAANFPDEVFRNYLLSQPYGSDEQLTDEEISNITYLSFENQNIKNLKGIENFTALTSLFCRYTPLAQLDVSRCTALETLYCDYNKLTTLNLSGLTMLQQIMCNNNQLNTINVSGCNALKYLYCQNNKLTSLNLSGCTALITLTCSSNKLNTLNVSGCKALTTLNSQYNKLTSLIISGCTALTSLSCSYNQLNTLNVSGCPALTSIYCEYNKIKASEMDKLVNSLPQSEYGGNFYAVLNGGDENEITQEQVEIARNKGWYVTYHIKNTSENSNSSNSNTNNNGTNTGSTTGLLNIENYNLKLYPNPTNNVLYVEEAGQEVLVYSSNGQIVLRQPTAASGPTRIDMGHLPTGTYLIRSGNAVAKVVKQ